MNLKKLKSSYNFSTLTLGASWRMNCQGWREGAGGEAGRLAGRSSSHEACQPRSFELQGKDTFWERGDGHPRACH